MDAIPTLPAYAHIDKEAVQCIAQASSRYQVPELLLHAILMQENGRTGQCSRNKNGTYDCGLAQINTTWSGYFARQGIRPEYLFGNACTNIQASAYILRDNYNRKGYDWFPAIMAYNVGPNNWTETRYKVGHKYASNVVARWWGFQDWVDQKNGITRVKTLQGVKKATDIASNENTSSVRIFEAPAVNQ